MDQKQILAHLRLQHAIQHPDVEDCWREGYENSQQELDESMNPYQEGSVEHQYYSDGWWTAFYGEQPLFESATVKATAKVKTSQTVLAALKQQAKAKVAAKAKSAQSSWEQAKTWIYATAYRLLGLGAAAIMAIIGYQLVDFAFI